MIIKKLKTEKLVLFSFFIQGKMRLTMQKLDKNILKHSIDTINLDTILYCFSLFI